MSLPFMFKISIEFELINLVKYNFDRVFLSTSMSTSGKDSKIDFSG